jgi:succinate dehydrogenase/fumarate reductase cytochrome b subunit
MSGRNTVVHSMHDLGLAAWFGGGLMGVIGLNGAASKAKDPTERLRLSSIGWGRWAPVQFTAIAVHGIGGIGLILGNKGRLASQGEARTNTAIKLVFTGLAGAATLTAAIAGSGIAKHADEGAKSVTEPSENASDELKTAQRNEKWLQWSIPLLTGVLLVLGAQQDEQYRPVAGFGGSLGKKVKGLVGR